jgi:ribonuclease HI
LNSAKKELFGGEKNTTNNRMELTAAIKSLEYFKKLKEQKIINETIKLYTDSNYVKDGISSWIYKWEKNNWKTSDKKNVKNIDLWKKLKELTKIYKVEWFWVKGHSNNPMNELADKLAKQATPI